MNIPPVFIRTLLVIVVLAVHPYATAQEPVPEVAAEPAPAAPSAVPAVPVVDEEVESVDGGTLSLGLSPEVIKKLDQEQLFDLAKREIRARRVPVTDMPGTFVPIVFFIITFFVIGAGLMYRAKKDRVVHQTLRAMVEKGAEIPAELLTPPVRDKISDLRKGILLLAGGIGISLLLLFIGMYEPDAMVGAASGVVPALIGVGYLVVWKLDKTKE